MNKKITISFLSLIIITSIAIITGSQINKSDNNTNKTTNKLQATVLSSNQDKVILQDKDNIIYTFKNDNMDVQAGDNILLSYTGIINKNKSSQDIEITKYHTTSIVNAENIFPSEWQDNGIFKDFYNQAYQKVKQLTLDEKIAQLLLVRYPNTNQVETLKQYQFGGYIFFEQDFRNKTKEEVITMISNLQKVAKIPILTAVDEEGGDVVRVSSNHNLVPTPFKSPSELYTEGGLQSIKDDTINKSSILSSLGINLNLAPVVDVSTEPTAYMYDRTLKQNTTTTSDFSKTVIEASKGKGVSYTLKHFPGYGNNDDTHVGSTVDNRNYGDIQNNDFPPFKAGINAGAEAILVSHNIVSSIDSVEASSLSQTTHNILRNELRFTGIIMTDDLSMNAVSSLQNRAVKALLGGNDIIITSNYSNDFNDIKNAITNGNISESTIDKLATRVIAWKYYKNMIIDNQK